MKCCIISTLYPPNIVGGAEKVTAKLAAGLVRAGHSVTVITLHDQPNERIEILDGVKVYFLPLDNLYWPYVTGAKPSAIKRLLWHIKDMWNSKAAARVGKILDQEKPDVVNSNNLTGFSVAVWAQAKRRGIRVVHTLHDYALLCPKGTLYKNGHQCATRCMSCKAIGFPKYLASRLVDQVVGVSKYTARKHLEAGYFSNAKATIIHNICDLPEGNQTNANNIKRPFSFGYIGRIEEEKGINVLLQAAEQMPDTGWRLMVAGRGRDPYVEELKAKYPSANIYWLGFSKPDDFYNQIDVLIVPSIWPDPFPGVIAEAGARQIPVIMANTGGMPEYLLLGLQGVAVPAGDAQSLVNEMKLALAGQGVMTQPTQKKADWKFELSEAKVVERYLACYQDNKA